MGTPDANMPSQPETFLGIPVFTEAERQALDTEFILDDAGIDAGTPLSLVVENLYKANGNLPHLIDYDVKYARRKEIAGYLGGEDNQDFEAGVREGYGVVFATFTIVSFWRAAAAGYTGTIYDYMSEKQNNTVVPIQTEAERIRFKKIRTGRHVIDDELAYRTEFWDKEIKSSELAMIDLFDYVRDSTTFERLIEDTYGINLAEIFDITHEEAHTWGFCHGVANAIAMYIQSHEYRVLRDLDFDAPEIAET